MVPPDVHSQGYALMPRKPKMPDSCPGAGKGTAWTRKPWSEALRVALSTYENKGLMVAKGQALRRIADKCVELAITGDDRAMREIADRLDGKPVQAIEGTGEDGSLLVQIVKYGKD